MDKDTRNLLANTTQALRKGLKEEFALQLEGTFDIHLDGSIADLDSENLTRRKIVEAILHRRASGESAAESVEGFLQEAAFTFLNRLAALKMMEARGIVQECISGCDAKGFNARGFKEFSGLAPGLVELLDGGYRLYLECLFDEIGREVGILFDRTDPASLLWPRRKSLMVALERVNHPDLAAIWTQDETIGWIYQYYNDPEERKKLRDPKQGGSASPRNSRELAIRNQFFTPRYVVEFLTDNTLGRLWYEMTQGKTGLKERCRYLIRRPSEIFLGKDEVAALPLPFDELLPAIIGDPREAYARIYPQTDPSSYSPPAGWVKEAFEGCFDNLPESGDALWTSWVSAAVPPDQIEAIIGEKWEPEESGKVDALRESILDGHPSPEARKLPVAWAILSDFARTSQYGGGYERPAGRKLWSYFRHLAQTWQRFGATEEEGLSQEDLFKRPVFIPHRPLKDPRAILMIDPACGSMHFGLYAFDLFEAIYAEAWDLEESLGTGDWVRPQGAGSLHETYATKAEFLKDVPRLILAHNIHGIDIDPRAAQIAGLALWLRAQRAWQEQGLRLADRPFITRSNIVCAEPMPGEADLLQNFVQESFPASEQPFFLRWLGDIFKTMKLAGEAGSLLKVEDEVRSLVAEARAQWQKLKDDFFSDPKLSLPDSRAGVQPQLDTGSWSLDSLASIPDEQFWAKAEERLYGALKVYAESTGRQGYQRRLFAEDAARGFAFIDLLRQRYDVALMNPPFGDGSLPSKPYLDETYGDTKGDVYKAFVECFQARLVPAGLLGIISSRTGFFLGQSEDWRTRVVLRLFRPIALADLGLGVLDAMVEVAAYVLRSLSEREARDLTLSLVPVLKKVALDRQERFSLPKWQAARDGLKRHQAMAELEHLEAVGFIQRCLGDIVRYKPLWQSAKAIKAPQEPVFPPLVCVRALAEVEKDTVLSENIRGSFGPSVFICNPAIFKDVPGSPFAYWVGRNFRGLFSKFPKYSAGRRDARHGPATSDDFKLLRAWWEVVPEHIKREQLWVPYAKGGAAVRFYLDQPLVVAWEERRFTFLGFFGRPGRWQVRLESSDCFFNPGITWPLRAAKFTPQILPAGCVFSARGYAAFSDEESLASLMGLMASSGFDFIFKILLGRFGFPEFVVGALQQLPIPPLSGRDGERFSELAVEGWRRQRSLDSACLISHAFVIPAFLAVSGSSLAERLTALTTSLRENEEYIAAIQTEIDDLAFSLYGLDATDREALTTTLATEAISETSEESGEDEEEYAPSADAASLAADLLSYALGAAFGRWDVRYATGQNPTPSDPEPFDSLPVCSPGMLQNVEGLPATQFDAPVDYPLRISWQGILMDDVGHCEDIEGRVREVLEFILPNVEAMTQEAIELIRVKSLREWFIKPAGFFGDHLNRYSKSRRQAPIYWQLSSPTGRYSIWLYYHRFTADTLFTVLRDYVGPKLQYEERRVFEIRQGAGATPSPSQRDEIIKANELVEDLRALRDELKRVAPLFKPNLNDGVIINYAPLWRMVALPKWRKDCQATWNKLVAGDYDWAHLTMHLWPERVIPKCATDRSLAIAHSLDEILWEEVEDKPGKPKKWRAKQISQSEIQSLIASRTSPAVKAALESFQSIPSSGSRNTKSRKAAR